MSSPIVDTLVEMGFSKEKVELAISRTGATDIAATMDWILSHEEELESQLSQGPQEPVPAPQTDQEPQEPPTENPASPEGQVAKSLKCEDCGKLFKNQDEVEFHASKTGHENFSESTEEKKPLTEEEKKEQLAKIEAKLKQRRLEREAREKHEALEKEKHRIKSGKEMLEAKKKYDEIEMKKLVDQRKREKEEERMAKQRVREQIEQDKMARKAKLSGQEPPKIVPVINNQSATTSVPKQNYSEVVLQIRLTNGTALTHTFGAKEPLSAVRLYVEINRNDDNGPFSLMTNYPKRVFGPEDYDVPLETLGLGPRAILIVSKS